MRPPARHRVASRASPASLRRLVAAVVGLLPVAVVVIEELHLDAVPALAGICGTVAALARIAAAKTVTDWSTRYLGGVETSTPPGRHRDTVAPDGEGIANVESIAPGEPPGK